MNIRGMSHGYRNGSSKGRSPEYTAWSNMLQRCNRPEYPSYSRYGGRGIKVCKRWHIFAHFYKDIGDRPSKKHSLDRKDNSKGYYRTNCRWATRHEQANNRRTNVLLTNDGRIQSVKSWCKEIGIGEHSLKSRLVKYPVSCALLPRDKFIKARKYEGFTYNQGNPRSDRVWLPSIML